MSKIETAANPNTHKGHLTAHPDHPWRSASGAFHSPKVQKMIDHHMRQVDRHSEQADKHEGAAAAAKTPAKRDFHKAMASHHYSMSSTHDRAANAIGEKFAKLSAKHGAKRK